MHDEIADQREFNAADEESDRLIVEQAVALGLPDEMVEPAKVRTAARQLAATPPITEIIQ